MQTPDLEAEDLPFLVPSQRMRVNEGRPQTMLRPGRKMQLNVGKGSLKEGWGGDWGNERKFHGLRRELCPKIIVPSSQETFENSRQMLLCPKFRLGPEPSCSGLVDHTSTGGSWAAQPQSSGAGVKDPPEDREGSCSSADSQGTEACLKITASVPWRLAKC